MGKTVRCFGFVCGRVAVWISAEANPSPKHEKPLVYLRDEENICGVVRQGRESRQARIWHYYQAERSKKTLVQKIPRSWVT
jgi:hypothetical protein